MAMEPGDLNSLQVEMDLARRPPAPAAAQAPGPGPEIVEEIAADAGGGGGGRAGPPVATTSYPGIQDLSVHLAPPGFTVCESFFDSGVFTCFNPEVVFGTETKLLANGSFSMDDDVWCNVTIKDGRIKSAELATDADGGATVSVHVADIKPDGVKQYHVGALVLTRGAEPDGVSIDKIPDAAQGATPTGGEGKLEIKGFKSATSSELTLSPSSATTLEFLARNPGSPSSLVFRKLKVPKISDEVVADDKSVEFFTESSNQSGQSGESGSENESPNKKLQIKGWNEADERKTTNDVASDLIEDAGNESGDLIVVKDSESGAVKYKEIGKLPFDDKSVEIVTSEQTKAIQIKGFDSASSGKVPRKTAQGGLEWSDAAKVTSTAPSDCVLSTGSSAVGSSSEAARADHVHKLPNTVVDTFNTQTVGGAKTFSGIIRTSSGNIYLFKDGNASPAVRFFFDGSSAASTSQIQEESRGVLTLVSPGHARLSVAPLKDGESGYQALQIATTGWVYGLADGKSIVAATVDGVKVLALKNFDSATGSAAGASDIVLVKQSNGNLGYRAMKEFQLDGTKQADILASANINIMQKSLAAGQNITLTPSQDGKTITISAAGGSGGTSGYTGTRYTLHDTWYDLTSHCLQMRRYTETWVDGVMTNSTLGSWENFSAGAQAVQETV